MTYVLAIDQGTTSTRAILFDRNLQPVAQAQQEFDQHFPQSGWVEHAPADILSSARETAIRALDTSGVGARDVAAIGLTNQRETTLLWDRDSGAPVAPAIVWQDRRTHEKCESLRQDGVEPMVTEKTGLLLDPYFSATKIAWLLDHVDGARARAEAGRLCFGTVDSFLIWHLTGGAVHATDATNASRTLLYDIAQGAWDPELCRLFDVPMSILPEVRDCDAAFGETDLLGARTPILGVAGDQHAATMGQACFAPGMLKSTYGTGCFALLNTGEKRIPSKNRLLTTLAYQLGGVPTYALEGSIFVAGAAVQWLRDGLGILAQAKDSQSLAETADPAQDVTLVPAFTGLGAPYWNAQSRGALFGLTRNTGPAELARAALESVGQQTADLVDAMRAEGATDPGQVLRVDGGMAQSHWAMQFLSDILGARVDRPDILETTALGVAWLAGQRAGVYPDADGFSRRWSADRSFSPQMSAENRARKRASWGRAIKATLIY